MIKLALIDVDGTLHGAGGVQPRVWEAADRARARGIRLGICTGRSGVGAALDYARRLDPDGLHIFDSGAVILGGDGAVHSAAALPLPLCEQVLSLALAGDLELELYTAEGGYYVRRETPDILTHAQMLRRRVEVVDLARPPGTPVRVQFVARAGEAWSRARAATIALGDVDLHEAGAPTMPGLVFASVTARGVSKLAAAHRVAGHYGLPDLARVAMAGDGDNDLELIRAAGLGIAMGNAPDRVRAAADRVVGHVDDAGLADALDAL
jgi:Cof subfamily protein (haloacid dehalogenase superfamily)